MNSPSPNGSGKTIKHALWFLAGFATCFLLLLSLPLFSAIKHPYGRLTYDGSDVEVTSDFEKTPVLVGREGKLFPYGMYDVKLTNGKILHIHKNNRGNAAIAEDGNLVLVTIDDNVIDVRLRQ